MISKDMVTVKSKQSETLMTDVELFLAKGGSITTYEPVAKEDISDRQKQSYRMHRASLVAHKKKKSAEGRKARMRYA